METQDHKKPSQSGHEGHSGVHICHKCGWPFPNPHPSARHRRAHRRVCGTLEGYRLDDIQDKTHLDGSDSEHVSDDDNKTPSGKVVERSMSRKSSSGVGSRSSRSTRSEDEVFADAVTDFVDNPGLQEASYGGISRGNSMQNTTKNKLDSPQLKEENEAADNLSSSTILPEDKELPTVKAMEGENNKVEASLLSHDHVSSPRNNKLEDSGVEKREDVPSEELIERRIPCSETAKEASEDVCALRGVSEESLDSVTVSGNIELSEKQTTSFKDKVESSLDVDSPGNLQAPMHSVQVVEPADGNAGKVGDMVEECDSRTEANENVYVLAVPDALHLQENSNIPVEDLDHKGGKFNVSMASDATLGVESVEFGKTHAIEESYSSTDFAEPGKSNYVCSVDDVPKTVHAMEDMLNPELGQNESIVERNTVVAPVLISDVKASDADIIEFSSREVLDDMKKESLKDQDVSSCTEQKSIVSTENVSVKGATVDGGDDQEMTANEGANTSDGFKLDEKDFIVDDNVSKVPVGELPVTSPISAEPTVNDFATQVTELTSDHDINNVGYDEKVKVEGTALNEDEFIIGGEETIEPVEAKTAPDCVLTIARYSDKNDELFELEKKLDQGELDKNSVSGNVMVDHSQPESLLTSLGVRELRTVEDNTGEGERKTVDNTGAVGKPDDHNDSILKISEDAGSSCPSSDIVADKSFERAANNIPTVTEGDKITKQHASVLVDVGDSSSQTDSLEGNWGSISVVSAVSDASPATDVAASKNPQPLAEEGTVSLEPKGGEEGHQHSENKTPADPQPQPQVAVEESPGASEIQAPENEQQPNSAGGSQIVACVANERIGGKREEEIIAKVNDWNSGKQHTALKTLLGEASARSRAESPNHNEDTVSVPKTDEIPITNNGLSSKTENVTLGSENPKTEAAKEEMGKEWNSPARYPVNVKTEKRRAKSRPYWVPFLCCSSVNAR